MITAGKMRILLRIDIRVLPVSTYADPHIRILPEATRKGKLSVAFGNYRGLSSIQLRRTTSKY